MDLRYFGVIRYVYKSFLGCCLDRNLSPFLQALPDTNAADGRAIRLSIICSLGLSIFEVVGQIPVSVSPLSRWDF